MSDTIQTLSGRREFLFLYDIKMGNPNGDPDENRPRVLPDGTHYVTDVRLKRFVRDFLKSQGEDILVDNIEGRTTNLTGRVAHYLMTNGKAKAEGKDLVDILLNSFIDARLFGSAFAFKSEKVKDKDGKESSWEPKPEPKTLTGAVQINMGEVLHQAEEVDIHGTSIFSSDESKTQGTFTTYFGLRYALMGFSGIANEHSAKLSLLTDDDYASFLRSLWLGVRSAGNTRTKRGQVPHLLISLEYSEGEEFQFGRLHDYVKLESTNGRAEKEWSSADDYTVNLKLLFERLEKQNGRLKRVMYNKSDDIQLAQELPKGWESLHFDS